jgi:hypothetical protein
MKRLIAVAVIAIVVGGYLIVQNLSPAHQVKSLVARQTNLWNDGDAAGLYATFSPQMQAKCPKASFDAAATKAQEQLSQVGSPDITVKITTLRIAGASATMTGTISVGPRVLYTIPSTDPVSFVKTPSGWMLDSAGTSADEACTTQTLPAVP